MSRYGDIDKLKRRIKKLDLICGEELVLKEIDKTPTLNSYDEAIRIISEAGQVFEAIRDLTDIAENQLRSANLKLQGKG